MEGAKGREEKRSLHPHTEQLLEKKSHICTCEKCQHHTLVYQGNFSDSQVVGWKLLRKYWEVEISHFSLNSNDLKMYYYSGFI